MSILEGFAATTVHNSRTLPVGVPKGGEKKLSVLTLDWDNVSAQQMQELAALHVKTRIQNERRVAKIDSPEKETVKVTDYCLHQGKKAKAPLTAEDAVKMLLGNGMTREQLLALLEGKQA